MQKKGSSFGSLYGTPTKIRGRRFYIFYSDVRIKSKQLAKLRPDQLDRLERLVEKPNCEFIGNGYSQMIQPLIPWEVNLKNQELGMQSYEKMLGLRPKIAIVNEMAFSASSSRSFTEDGYKD